MMSPCWHGVKRFSRVNCLTLQAGCIICTMDDEIIKQVRSELARQGGLARAKALTARQRRESAIKASKAAASARKRKAREGKAKNG
jgi:hypothetical protein